MTSSTNGSNIMVGLDGSTGSVKTLSVDALVVGGGFGGCYLLHKLRKQGLKVKLIDALDGFGGVWRANWYPGARVDSEMPYYLYSAPELVKSWTWTERFPGGSELRRYFDYVDKVWDLSKDSFLNTRVIGAEYNESDGRWHIRTSGANELHVTCRWFVPSVGTTHKQYIPEWPGMSTFRGDVHHPAAWPHLEDPVSPWKGKRIAVIGAGSSGLQIVQELGKQASQLTQFIRSPIIAFPMQQRSVTPREVEQLRPVVGPLQQIARQNPGGVYFNFDSRKAMETSPEEREAHWKSIWEGGGFRFVGANFHDYMVDKDANRLSYDFWAKQVRQRITDPVKRDILAPLEQPYFLNGKRSGVEQDYYDVMSLPHVDVTNSPIKRFDETGILTEDGKHRAFDLVAVATGYDAVTGPLMDMGIKGRGSVSLNEHWSDGIRTFLGISVHNFPNMFFPYGPQSPSALTAGTPFIEQQVEWVCDMIKKASESGSQTVEATREAEEGWMELVRAIAAQTLMDQADSWWNGSNIPGKKREMLLFLGGSTMYFEKCRDALDTMTGFSCVGGSGAAEMPVR